MSRGDDRIPDPDLAAYARDNRDAVYELITGNDPTDIAEMVNMLGGTKATADALGVDPRTVRRWKTTVGQRSVPKPHNQNALRNQAQAARQTADGRRRALGRRRESLMRTRGIRMSGKSHCGPLIGDSQYRRLRHFKDMHVSIGVTDQTIDSFLEQGEESAYYTFNHLFAETYELTGFEPALGEEEGFEVDWIFEDMSGLRFKPDMDA